MSSVTEHYENLLAEYYSWMFGNFDQGVEGNYQFFKTNGIGPVKSGKAVDLGAGSGFQSIALARLGFTVLAVDLSGKLLDELKRNSASLPVTAVRGDVVDFAAQCQGPVELCVCMGDTLPHLESLEKVSLLFERVYGALVDGGAFITTFRDQTAELKGTDRFIPVRSDADTLFTCFLEYSPDSVQVHDLVYTRNGGTWTFRKSSYRKLRISLPWALEQLKKTGFAVQLESLDKGMITIIARKGPLAAR